MEAFKWAGSVSHGTLREQDLLPAFWEVLLDLAPERIDHETIERERRAYLAFSGAYDVDPDYSVADAQSEVEQASHFLHWLQGQLDELAPDGYYFGTIEGDGSDFGFWPLAEELDRLIDPYLRTTPA